jgi:hypothetical protein
LYVDDIMATSVDPEDLEWLRLALVDKYQELTYHDGDVHHYLGQRFDFSIKGEVKVDMAEYISDALDEYGIKGTRATPADVSLFDIDKESPTLDAKRAAEFHSRVAKIQFSSIRCRPDVQLTVSFLSGRVTSATEQDWSKLNRMLMYLNGTRNLGVVLRLDDGYQVFSHIDASFAVHHDMRSHTGAFVTLGNGPISVSSKKQKLTTKSSTEAELVGLSDSVPQAVWIKELLEGQGYPVKPAKVFQDNKSTIALANKGKSTSSRTRHIAIRYFFIKDRIDAGEVVIEHLGSDQMIADGLTKPLQGEAFKISRDRLMGTALASKK